MRCPRAGRAGVPFAVKDLPCSESPPRGLLLDVARPPVERVARLPAPQAAAPQHAGVRARGRAGGAEPDAGRDEGCEEATRGARGTVLTSLQYSRRRDVGGLRSMRQRLVSAP